MKRERITAISIIAVLVIVILIGLTFVWNYFDDYPIVGRNLTPSISTKSEMEIPKEILSDIINTEQGFYNSNLPLFAVHIDILDATKQYILYRVNYFPFGNIERSYSKENSGDWIFNLEKPLIWL